MRTGIVSFFIVLAWALCLQSLCFSDDLDGICLSVDGEWLYLRADTDSNILYSETAGGGAFETKALKPIFPYRSGWRVGVNYECFHLKWMHLQTTASQHFSSPFFFVADRFISGSPNLQDKRRLLHDAIEGYFTYPLFNGCNLKTHFILGVQYVWQGFKETIDNLDLSFRLAKQNAHVWGVGPEIGVNLEYCLFNFCTCKRIFLHCRAAGSFLVSRSKNTLNSSIITGSFTHVSNTPSFRVCPYWDVKTGVRLVNCFFRNFFIEGGYEFITYRGALNLFTGVGTIVPNNIQSNVDFQGPYIEAGVVF